MSPRARKLMAVVTASLASVLIGLPAGAHHSIALQFDMTKEITVEGRILEMEWRNPHAWLQIEVESDEGRPRAAQRTGFRE